MFDHRYVQQPARGNHADALADLVARAGLTHLDMAMAYASDSGVTRLLRTIEANTGAKSNWAGLEKRFLIGVDWLRSQPTALDRLAAIPQAQVSVHDGLRVVGRVGCTPRVPWHPKATFAFGDHARAALIGSGNLSRNGLEIGLEVGLLAAVTHPVGPTETSLWDSLETNIFWFQERWVEATPLSNVRAAYGTRYAEEALKRAAPTEDDSDPHGVVAATRRGITLEQMRAMRIASNLWIETGNITKNRGPSKPGDQLMMSAMTRVFFGFPPLRVQTDTALGSVPIRHAATATLEMRPLRFSNNSMDVLTLPVPGSPWPTSYDQTCLLFTKVVHGHDLQFELRTGDGKAKAAWRATSRSVDGAYAMSSGRQWGVFG